MGLSKYIPRTFAAIYLIQIDAMQLTLIRITARRRECESERQAT